MKAPSENSAPRPQGFTLLELTVVMLVLIALISGGFYANNAIGPWSMGREASETLRSVYIAQRTYLADYPTSAPGSLTGDALRPYLPGNPATFPTVTGLDGVERAININVSPPTVRDGDGSVYDPSGSPNDSLWDVGE